MAEEVVSVRASFVEHFGEDEAVRVEEASIGHIATPPGVRQVMEKVTSNYVGTHENDDWGSDPFKYHFLNCIAQRCFDVDDNRAWHGIVATEEALRMWALAHGDLAEFDGDVPDYLALMAGAYISWLIRPEAFESDPRNPPGQPIAE